MTPADRDSSVLPLFGSPGELINASSPGATQQVRLTGLSHKSAPVEVRERLSVDPGVTPEWLRALRETAGTEECALLATCNRMEVYLVPAAGETADGGQKRLLQFLAVQAGVAESHLEPHLYCLDSTPAVRHLFRVAAGLDSMVMGESQILS